LRIGGGGRRSQSIVRVEGGRAKNGQVVLVGTNFFPLPRVWEGLGSQFGVAEHFWSFLSLNGH